MLVSPANINPTMSRMYQLPTLVTGSFLFFFIGHPTHPGPRQLPPTPNPHHKVAAHGVGLLKARSASQADLSECRSESGHIMDGPRTSSRRRLLPRPYSMSLNSSGVFLHPAQSSITSCSDPPCRGCDHYSGRYQDDRCLSPASA